MNGHLNCNVISLPSIRIQCCSELVERLGGEKRKLSAKNMIADFDQRAEEGLKSCDRRRIGQSSPQQELIFYPL